MNTAILPAIVGVGTTDTGLLSLGALGRNRRAAETPLRVAWDGTTYLVGTGVERFARPVERLDFRRLADGPEIRALTYGTLGQLLGPGEHQAALVVGFPVEVLADKALAQAVLQQLRGWLVGVHEFTVDEQTTRLTVLQVQALAQPAGAYFAWGLDERGKWTRPTADLQALVGIADAGFNTLDIFTVQGGQVVARFTGGDTAGMRRAAEIVVQGVRQKYGVTLSLHQADALLRERRPTLASAGQSLDLTALAQQARATAASGVISFLESRWGNGRQFAHLLFTGGGMLALQESLLAQYPYGVILPEPVTANATGLARYARRLYPEAPVVIGLDPGFGGFKVVAL
jgi:hypothetical protein